MASRADLVRKILKNLGIWQAGQELPPEDYVAVNEELPTKLLAMSRGDIYNASVDSIPDEGVDAIADYIAATFIKTFGIGPEEAAELRADADAAVGYLKYLKTNKPTYSRTRAEYF